MEPCLFFFCLFVCLFFTKNKQTRDTQVNKQTKLNHSDRQAYKNKPPDDKQLDKQAWSSWRDYVYIGNT